MNLHVDIQSASTEPAPEEDDIRGWISAALRQAGTGIEAAEVCLRLVDEAEMAQLNHSYRGKTGPTNVLSFPADLPPELQLPLLGDIVICAPVVLREAREQGKSARAHWAHMLVHGSLHLLGHDHVEAADAAVMEALETDILGQLGFSCPYSDHLHEESLSQ
ncbi:rRNA maturation RNase YbeY [Kineobactrum salinum]|uniref:Endoribonuclease YbeY n=1 Tax=Kineobactrum salinum TaxID=2708301 RepID=A0A6C0U361_9GAMM|nr:rRNA maturation RNase YbeY [Kineobactrum salinum]QIB64805.1 rRNA maturation RNase YbeY [Kineobactrum salinum]